MEPRPPALGLGSLSRWTTREVPTLSFFVKVALAIWSPLRCFMNFRMELSISAKKKKKCWWDFEWDCIESADHFGLVLSPSKYEVFSPWIWDVLPFIYLLSFLLDFPGGLVSLPVQEMQEMQVQSLGREDPLEEDMATHSGILAWKILRTEEPSGL